MRPKTILVCLTTPDHTDALLRVAVPLARKYRAHLIGLHTIEALSVYPGIAMHVPGPAFEQFNESQQREAEAIRAIFDARLAPELVPCEFRLLRAEAMSAGTRMVESARAADLVIMAQEDGAVDRPDQHHVQERVIRESGRPVIVVPPDHDGAEIGDSFLIGWSDTREAARAAHDMLALANDGAAVTVLRVGRSAGDALHDSRGIDLVETLARHGLNPSLAQRDLNGASVADVLEQAAFEIGAGLIVTGAFGHSKVYDFVIGATSHALLRGAKLPVLFSK
jgi:nucleotide-binding universal stress UspA family protein